MKRMLIGLLALSLSGAVMAESDADSARRWLSEARKVQKKDGISTQTYLAWFEDHVEKAGMQVSDFISAEELQDIRIEAQKTRIQSELEGMREWAANFGTSWEGTLSALKRHVVTLNELTGENTPYTDYLSAEEEAELRQMALETVARRAFENVLHNIDDELAAKAYWQIFEEQRQRSGQDMDFFMRQATAVERTKLEAIRGR